MQQPIDKVFVIRGITFRMSNFAPREYAVIHPFLVGDVLMQASEVNGVEDIVIRDLKGYLAEFHDFEMNKAFLEHTSAEVKKVEDQLFPSLVGESQTPEKAQPEKAQPEKGSQRSPYLRLRTTIAASRDEVYVALHTERIAVTKRGIGKSSTLLRFIAIELGGKAVVVAKNHLLADELRNKYSMFLGTTPTFLTQYELEKLRGIDRDTPMFLDEPFLFEEKYLDSFLREKSYSGGVGSLPESD